MLTTKYEELVQKKFTDLPVVVQNMLVDFSYNMRGEYGIFPASGFPGFPEACKALQREDWAAFAHEIAESAYADQVGPRRAGYWGIPTHTTLRETSHSNDRRCARRSAII
jgi:hypothetical protein